MKLELTRLASFRLISVNDRLNVPHGLISTSINTTNRMMNRLKNPVLPGNLFCGIFSFSEHSKQQTKEDKQQRGDYRI